MIHKGSCSIAAEWVCETLSADPFTIIITAWIGLQITWVTMLVIVQSVQVARATTTFEAMRGHLQYGPGVRDSKPGAPTFGTSAIASPQPVLANGAGSPSDPRPNKKEFLGRWKMLLGLDAFVATARSGFRPNRWRQGNPFSRGVVRNCADFWFDTAPLFGRRVTGTGMLDGVEVDYSSMYDLPRPLNVPPV